MLKDFAKFIGRLAYGLVELGPEPKVTRIAREAGEEVIDGFSALSVETVDEVRWDSELVFPVRFSHVEAVVSLRA